MSNWQPRHFDPDNDGVSGVEQATRGGVAGVLCPACGGHRVPGELMHVEDVDDEVTGGVAWACGACVSRWISSGRITRSALAQALGAPAEHVSMLEGADTPNLSQLEVNLLAEIDREAEAERAKYITLGDGQAMTYEQKRQELARFDAGDAGPFPFLQAEADMRGVDVSVIAGEVRAATEQWRMVGAQIEAKRLAAKNAVRSAETVEEKRAAAQVDWSLSHE